MANLRVSMPEAMKDYIEREAEHGNYSTPSEFVCELVRNFRRCKATEAEGRLIEALLSGKEIAEDSALEHLHQKLSATVANRLREAVSSPALEGEEAMAELLKKSKARTRQPRTN